MEHKIVISGEGSAHPKLGVKKKNTVREENASKAILNDMIESGKLSLDHAIAKTRPGGTLRGIFKCSEDETMVTHVDAPLRLRRRVQEAPCADYDPKARRTSIRKRSRKTTSTTARTSNPRAGRRGRQAGRATCKISQEKIDAASPRAARVRAEASKSPRGRRPGLLQGAALRDGAGQPLQMAVRRKRSPRAK